MLVPCLLPPSSAALRLSSPAALLSASRALHASAARQKSERAGRYKVTLTGNKPLTYEMAFTPDQGRGGRGVPTQFGGKSVHRSCGTVPFEMFVALVLLQYMRASYHI